MVLLLFGNVLNWALAACGIYFQTDFALYLLGLFMLNTGYYFVFYIIMKVLLRIIMEPQANNAYTYYFQLLHGERINCLTITFLILSSICAASSLYCYFQQLTAWSVSTILIASRHKISKIFRLACLEHTSNVSYLQRRLHPGGFLRLPRYLALVECRGDVFHVYGTADVRR